MSGIIDLTSDDESVPSRPPLNQNNTSDDEDEDLKLAIALSLQDQTSIEEDTKTVTETIDLPQSIPERTKPTSGPPGLLGLDRKAMEAERLARLKRKREPDTKLERPIQPPSDPFKPTTARLSPPPPRRQKPNPTKPAPTPTPSQSSTIAAPPPPTFPNPQILLTSQPSRITTSNPPSKTPPKYLSISLPDILTPPHPTLTLKSTLLSSYIADLDWLFTHFNTRSTTFLLLLHAQTPQHRALLESDFGGLSNVKLVMPEVMGGSGNMHSKIVLLFYQPENATGGGSAEEICRLVIPSANLTRADWGVGGVMENVLFVVDLPLKRPSQEHKEYPFERKFRAQLEAMGVPESVLQKLGRFDFQDTRGVEFVYSKSGSTILGVGGGNRATATATTTTQGMRTTKAAGGDGFFEKAGKGKEKEKHEGERPTHGAGLSAGEKEDARRDRDTHDPARTGLLSLHDAVTSQGLAIPITDLTHLPQVDFITSSLGNLTTQFIRQLYLAICGQLDPSKITSTTVASKRPNTKSAEADAAFDEVIAQNLKIYFPTDETVRRSKGGPSAGGTICFQSKWWESNELIRKCLCDCVGVREDGILMHSKILYVRFDIPKAVLDCSGRERLYAGWAYVGSANLSESAWGRVVSDAKSRQPKLTCRNWESGVLVPVEVTSTTTKVEGMDTKTEDGTGRHLGKEVDKEGKALSKYATSKHGSRFDSCKSPTSAKEVAMHVKAGKKDNAMELRGERGRSVNRDASDESIMQSAMGATKSPKDASRDRGLFTGGLSKVFSEVVPVPIQHPAAGHIARQQAPWFFME